MLFRSIQNTPLGCKPHRHQSRRPEVVRFEAAPVRRQQLRDSLRGFAKSTPLSGQEFDALQQAPPAVEIKPQNPAIRFTCRVGLLLTRTRQRIKPRTEAPFDLMVDDIDAARELCKAKGLKPSRIQRSHFHRSFIIIGPDGYVLTITSSHTGNRVI